MKISLFFVTCLMASSICAKAFPLRSEYPSVKTISSSELMKDVDNTLIIDARSPFEFGVIHINNAQNISINDKLHFVENLFSLIKGKMDQKIVFYCNGQTCGKSYKAAKRAQSFGLKNIYAYDAGIMEWGKLFPSKTTLLNSSPVNKSRLISSKKFQSHLLTVKQFKKRCITENRVIFDGRDLIQKRNTPAWLKEKALSAPFFGLVKILADKSYQKSIKGKTLCIYDAAGKQVQWLQYHLEEHGYKNYYFLKDGMWSIYKSKGAN